MAVGALTLGSAAPHLIRGPVAAPAAIGWAQGVAGNGRNGSQLGEQETKRQQEINDKLISQSGKENQYQLHEEMGRMMTEYFLPLLGHFGFKDYLKASPDVPDSDVTAEYCARNNWIVGSPATVTEKIEKIYHEVGGFGTLLVFGFDYKHKPEAWHNSLRLLKQEVMPRLKHLDAGLTKAA